MGLVLVRLSVVEKAIGPIKFMFPFPSMELSVEGGDYIPASLISTCSNVTNFH